MHTYVYSHLVFSSQRLMLLREGKLVWNSLVSELPGGSAETLYFDLVETPATEELPWLRL